MHSASASRSMCRARGGRARLARRAPEREPAGPRGPVASVARVPTNLDDLVHAISARTRAGGAGPGEEPTRG